MRFVDTNILLYSLELDTGESEKGEIARKILLSADLAFSVQVLQEFYVQATHSRRPDALTHDFAVRLIEKWMRFRIQDNTVSVLRNALELKERYGTSYWDAAIIAAAQCARCNELLSEDLNHGQQYGSVTVVNPFVKT